MVAVYVYDFDQLIGQEVPEALWWHIADDSPYIAEFDFLTSATFGYPAMRQLKFNPRAYGVLTVEIPQW